MESFIKIPTDFKSLHDLKDLVNNYDLISRLSDALNNYQRAHIDSYLMTMDEVLEYIPIKHHEEYKVKVSDHKHIDRVYINEKDIREDLASLLLYALSEKRHYNGNSRKYEIEPVENHKQERIFIVNTIKKEINVIYWFSDKLFYNRCSYGLNRKVEYEINEEKILSVKVHFSFTDYQQVGGAEIWCGTGETYFRGGQRVPYTREGYEIYQFDTKTNQYLGYIESVVVTPERKWHKEKSYY